MKRIFKGYKRPVTNGGLPKRTWARGDGGITICTGGGARKRDLGENIYSKINITVGIIFNLLNIIIAWCVTPCSLVYYCQGFEGKCCPHLQGIKIK
jgi:hypothetical protein